MRFPIQVGQPSHSTSYGTTCIIIMAPSTKTDNESKGSKEATATSSDQLGRQLSRLRSKLRCRYNNAFLCLEGIFNGSREYWCSWHHKNTQVRNFKHGYEVLWSHKLSDAAPAMIQVTKHFVKVPAPPPYAVSPQGWPTMDDMDPNYGLIR